MNNSLDAGDGRTQLRIFTDGILHQKDGAVLADMTAPGASALHFTRTVAAGADLAAEHASLEEYAARRAAESGLLPLSGASPERYEFTEDGGTRIALVWPALSAEAPASRG